MPFESAKNILSKLIKQKGLSVPAQAAWVCQEGQKVINKTFNSPDLIAKNYQDKVLTITVPNAAWAQEVQLKNYLIIKKINQRLNRSQLGNRAQTEQKLVKRIKIRID